MSQQLASFGPLLQRYRLASGVSQEELAERAGLSRRGISDLERGARQTPHLGTVRRLAEALGLDADAQAALLTAARGRPVSSALPPALSPGAVPLSLTSFVGREPAVAEVRDRLASTRLLTLTGTGGIGKTRLAFEVARRWAEQDSAVALVELAPLRDPTLVPRMVATCVGVREQPGRAVVETLIETLRPQRVLLVLDNCEHVLAACAELAQQLLHACPELRVLATSREALRVAGESQWRVPPLECAAPGQLPPFGDLAQRPAVRLFVDRASAVDSTFSLSEQNAPTVAEICHKLDGIPLAIELAAARANVLSVDQIAHRLDDRLRLLTSSSRSLPERQRTLRTTLEWSYDLLADDERRLFERLAVFAGGWTLEACELVCSGDPVTRDDVLDLLGRLVDKSLVVVASDGITRRYRLLETIREHAEECLERSGEIIPVRSAHAAAFVALTEAAASQLGGAHQLQWLRRIEVDYDNIRAAVHWLLDRSEIASVLRMAPALSMYGWVRGGFSEQRQWAEECLACCDEQSPFRSMAAVLAGTVAYTLGDYARAFPLLDESLSLARREDNKPVLARALLQLGFASPLRGGLRSGIELFTEAERLFRELGQLSEAANALIGLGQIARELGEYDQAERYFGEALAAAKDAVDTRFTAQGLQALGSVSVMRGDLARATAYLRQSVALWVELRNAMFLGYCALHFAQIALARSDGRRAATLLGAAAGLWKSENSAIYPTYQAAYARACEAATASVGEPVFARLFTDGQALSLEDTAEYAVADGEPSSIQPSSALAPQA